MVHTRDWLFLQVIGADFSELLALPVLDLFLASLEAFIHLVGALLGFRL